MPFGDDAKRSVLAAIVHENYLPGFLGLLQRVAQPSSQLGKILLLVFIILFIQWRPRGLFARKGRAIEA